MTNKNYEHIPDHMNMQCVHCTPCDMLIIIETWLYFVWIQSFFLRVGSYFNSEQSFFGLPINSEQSGCPWIPTSPQTSRRRRQDSYLRWFHLHLFHSVQALHFCQPSGKDYEWNPQFLLYVKYWGERGGQIYEIFQSLQQLFIMVSFYQVLELQNTLDDLTHRVDKVGLVSTHVHQSITLKLPGEGGELEVEKWKWRAGTIHRKSHAGTGILVVD